MNAELTMHPFKSDRGSVLIVALVFSAIIAISLTSFINLSLNAGKIANRGFYLNAAQNLVDVGIERTIWALNDERLHPTPGNWTAGGFTEVTSGTEYRGTFPSYTLSGGAAGEVKVWASYDSVTKLWHTVSKATVTLGNGSTLFKMAECYLQQRSYSDGGMVSREGVRFTGDVTVDSWISRPTPSDDVRYIPYPAPTGLTTNRRSNAQVSSPSVSPDSIDVGNADIYGHVAIGADTITTNNPDVGATGRIGDFGAANRYRDPNRMTCDFTASFADNRLPSPLPAASPAIVNGSGLTTLTGNQTKYYPSITLGNSGDSIEIGSSITGSPAAHVVIVVPDFVSMGGSSQIIINRGSTLTMYVGGNFTMGGTSGIQNGTATVGSVKGIPNNPDSFTLLGTRTEAQVVASGGVMNSWTIRGNGYLSCVINAPNADVEIKGTSDTYGSLVGNSVYINGNGGFHQDESLKDSRKSSLWGLAKWRELSTATDRAAYATQLAF
jgi:hypothetical protein